MGAANRRRKQDHIRIALSEDVDFHGVSTGLEEYRFVHQALPELDLAAVDTSTSLFGKKLAAPLVISSMVGGVEPARQLNQNLARAAQAMGIAMGVGSLRAGIEDPGTQPTYQVRDVAPGILLFANLGAVQLNYGYGVAECRKAVDVVGADALVLHLNPLQEALQPEGNANFGGLLKKIEQVCRQVKVPVVVKEVGCGISEVVARQLASAGVVGLDTAGAGGTSWSEVEKHRADTELRKVVAGSFSGWGIPTAQSVLMSRRGAPGLSLIASGGIRTGIDVAKAIALGADCAGIANPLLKAASVSAEAVTEHLKQIIEELRISMFCIGVGTIAELKNTTCLVSRGATVRGLK